MEKSKFKPMGNHVAIKRQKADNKLDSGMLVADAEKGLPRVGVIVGVPQMNYLNKEYFRGELFCGIKEGDVVLYHEHAGTYYEDVYYLKINEIIGLL